MNRSAREIEFFYNASDKIEFWQKLARISANLGVLDIPVDNVMVRRTWNVFTTRVAEYHGQPLLFVTIVTFAFPVEMPADLLWDFLNTAKKRLLIVQYEQFLETTNRQTKRQHKKSKKPKKSNRQTRRQSNKSKKQAKKSKKR